MLNELLYAQILSVDEDCILVKKDNKVFKLELISDHGGCCGYADFETTLLYSPNSLDNPIITNITLEAGNGCEGDTTILTFFGESKPLATIASEAGSGSGWNYGACVSLHCKALDIDETLASW